MIGWINFFDTNLGHIFMEIGWVLLTFKIIWSYIPCFINFFRYPNHAVISTYPNNVSVTFNLACQNWSFEGFLGTKAWFIVFVVGFNRIWG